MAWMKFDVNVPEHPKLVAAIAAAGGEAGWLWFAGNCYCRRTLTDGFLSDQILPSIAPGLKARTINGAAKALVSAGLWHREPTGYRVHDFLDWNPSKEQVQEARAKDSARKRSEGSGWNPSGIRKDSEPSRAGARQARAISPLLSSEEEGAGETEPAAAAPRPKLKHAPGPLAGSLPRDHMDHAFCGDRRLCVKESLFTEMAHRYGEGGREAVRGFLQNLNDSLAEGEVPGGVPWVLRHYDRWLADLGKLKPAPAPPAAPTRAPDDGVPDSEATRRLLRTGRYD